MQIKDKKSLCAISSFVFYTINEFLEGRKILYAFLHCFSIYWKNIRYTDRARGQHSPHHAHVVRMNWAPNSIF